MRWLADECFDNDIIRGLLRRSPDLDLVRAQDVSEIAGRDDETLLAWAAKHGRVVLTHDLATMVPALRRQRQSAPTAIVLVPDSLATGQVIDDVLLLDQYSNESDWITVLSTCRSVRAEAGNDSRTRAAARSPTRYSRDVFERDPLNEPSTTLEAEITQPWMFVRTTPERPVVLAIRS